MALTKDSNSSGGSGGGAEEHGILSFGGADLKFAAKKPKVRFSTTYLSSIRDVELHDKAITGQEEGNRCRVVVSSTTKSVAFFGCGTSSLERPAGDGKAYTLPYSVPCAVECFALLAPCENRSGQGVMI